MNGTVNTLMRAHRHQTNHYIKNGEHRSPQQNDMICKQRRRSSHDGAKLVHLRKNWDKLHHKY